MVYLAMYAQGSLAEASGQTKCSVLASRDLYELSKIGRLGF